MSLQQHPYRYVRATIVALGTSVLFIGLAPASASSANISHSYQSKKAIIVGSLVSLDSTRQDFVEAANTTNAARILGVAVNSDDSLLAVDAGKDSVQVATSGTAPALVSDVNGDIHVGDQVAVSPFDGIGMKATDGGYVIGLAQSSFTANSNGAQKQSVKDMAGVYRQVAIGSIKVGIAPGAIKGGTDGNITGLQKLARTLTGKVISPGRIIAAIAIIGITLAALIVLIYGAIYSTIISVGRNPLARYDIYRSLATVLGMAVLAAGVAVGIALLLVR